jgi:hypothetical protein
VSRLHPHKCHVRYIEGVPQDRLVLPRRYTLTHSDVTGELFLTIGVNFDRGAISGWHARFMRDEVLAEWVQDGSNFELHIHCHVSGGFILGPAWWRYAIFQRELPLVLEALRFGDHPLYEAHPELDEAPILIHFHARQKQYDRVESRGKPKDYQIEEQP